MNTRTKNLVLSATALAALTAPALAQSNISPVNKFCWGENVGFINFRDPGTPVGAQGVRITARYLFGFAWGENIGYINFGDVPDNGLAYANPTVGPVVGVPDFGVNRDPGTGDLSGFAWGENVGWINFGGGALATPANPARFDAAAVGGGRFRGYAWGENIGWINLDHAMVFVGAGCICDWNNSGALSVQDIFDFLASYFGGAGDFNFSGATSVQDIFDFLECYFGGCP